MQSTWGKVANASDVAVDQTINASHRRRNRLDILTSLSILATACNSNSALARRRTTEERLSLVPDLIQQPCFYVEYESEQDHSRSNGGVFPNLADAVTKVESVVKVAGFGQHRDRL